MSRSALAVTGAAVRPSDHQTREAVGLVWLNQLVDSTSEKRLHFTGKSAIVTAMVAPIALAKFITLLISGTALAITAAAASVQPEHQRTTANTGPDSAALAADSIAADIEVASAWETPRTATKAKHS